MASIYPPNDPYWSNVVLLMDGSSPTQDLSEDARAVTKSGDVYSTTAPSSPVEQALRFNRTGTSDYLSIPSTGVTLTQDFCFECRVYISGYASGPDHPNDLYMLWKSYSGSGSGTAFEIKYTGKWNLFLTDGTYLQSPIQVPLNRFVHLAGTKQGTTYRLFQDGKLQNSVSRSVNPGGTWRMGGDQDVTNLRSLDGYMRDIRLTFGQARYTADFIPPGVGTTPSNAIMFSCNS